jgi:beta-galactosidase
MDLLPEARAYHQALMEANHCVDAMDPREDLSRYALVIAPRLYCLDQRSADNLRRFVEGGGVLCLTPRSGVVDEYNTVFDVPAPGPLREIAGVEVDDYGALDQPVALRGDAVGGSAQAEVWADEIILTTARSVATYGEGWLAGMPAITLNESRKGKVLYLGTVLRGEALASFLGWLTKLAGVAPVLATPANVRALERASATERYLFLLNFSDAAQTVPLGEEWSDAFDGAALTKAEIGPDDLRILRRPV